MNRLRTGLLVILLGVCGAAGAQQAVDRQQLYELLDRLGQLEREVRQLRGDQEVLQYKLEEAERRDQKRYQDLYSRLQSGAAPAIQPSTSSPTGIAPVAPPPSVATAPPAPVTASTSASVAAASADPAAEKAAYEEAFAKLREGAFDEAIIGFNAFLVRYPQGEYADNSRYWLGEAYYVNRDFPAAQQAFEAVISDFPASNKIPDARLKLGFTLDELNRNSEARRILQSVAADYPGTSVARLAERRLKQM